MRPKTTRGVGKQHAASGAKRKRTVSPHTSRVWTLNTQLANQSQPDRRALLTSTNPKLIGRSLYWQQPGFTTYLSFQN
eukprot:s352_g44.t1